MDPNLLSFFSVPNNQTLNPVDQNGESSAAGASSQQGSQSQPSWRQAGLDADFNFSDNKTSVPSGGATTSFDQGSAGATDFAFVQPSMPASYNQNNRPSLGNRANLRNQQRRRDAHERKRTRLDSEAPALESLDYWIQFDDDEAEKTGSFEIDFSKRYSLANNRPGFDTNATPGLGTGLYTQPPQFKGVDFLDDSALDNALSEDEELFETMNLEEQLAKIETMPPPEVPPREGLYSTPLSWEKPEPGLRMDPIFNANTGGSSAGMGSALGGGFAQTIAGIGNNQILSNEEQRQLLAVAMNTGRTPASFMPPSGFGLGFGAGLGTGLPADFNASIDAYLGGSSSSKDHTPAAESSRAREKAKAGKSLTSRESSAAARPSMSRTDTDTTMTTDKGKEKAKPGDRTAHNDIERKYRTNLKDKIAELRSAVPALHSMTDDDAEEAEASNSQRNPKVSKGTVLTKATEYIQHLERRNKNIMKEHQELARRLQAFEQLLNASARQPFLMPNHSRTLFDPRGFC